MSKGWEGIATKYTCRHCTDPDPKPIIMRIIDEKDHWHGKQGPWRVEVGRPLGDRYFVTVDGEEREFGPTQIERVN